MWQRLFLQHAKLYLEGSKAPDNEFKDFKNHVLHTRDGYWGGAPEKVRSWYNHLVEALAQQDWPTAVYCAGVLSHYYTDPLHPFHTAQSEAENNIHRAVEWSISKAYDELRALGEVEFPNIDVELPPGPNWLAQLVCQGAEKANAHYEKLIAHYDIQRGVIDPPAGLDRVARRLVAELIRYATLSYAAVLDRAIEESNVHAPDVSLAAATLAAVAQVPFKLIARRIADKEERRLVERMYDELLATGTVEKHLAEDDRTVRDLHARGGAGQAAAAAAGVQGVSLQAARAGRHPRRPASAPPREQSAARTSWPLRPLRAPPVRRRRQRRWRRGRRASPRPKAGLTRAAGARGAPLRRARPSRPAAGSAEPRYLSHARQRRRRRPLDRPQDGRAPGLRTASRPSGT